MKNIKGKVLAFLVIYFAGFATAIYGLAPVDQSLTANEEQTVQTPFCSFTKSDQFAIDCGKQLRKWSSLAEDAAGKAGDYIQLKMAANKLTNESMTVTNGVKSDGVSEN